MIVDQGFGPITVEIKLIKPIKCTVAFFLRAVYARCEN